MFIVHMKEYKESTIPWWIRHEQKKTFPIFIACYKIVKAPVIYSPYIVAG